MQASLVTVSSLICCDLLVSCTGPPGRIGALSATSAALAPRALFSSLYQDTQTQLRPDIDQIVLTEQSL